MNDEDQTIVQEPLDEAEQKDLHKRANSKMQVTLHDGKFAPETLQEAKDLASLMALAGIAIPQYMRGVAGAALRIIMQAAEWNMSPYGVASQTYEVNGNVAYMGQLFMAVMLKKCPIVGGRPLVTYRGEGQNRRCKVVAKDIPSQQTLEYETPAISAIALKSPLWKTDPDQQLHYYAVRSFMRRHYPDIMLGCYTPEEIRESKMRDITPGVIDNRLEDEPPESVIVQGEVV